MSVDLPLLVIPDYAWRVKKFRSPHKLHHVEVGAIYLLLGTQVTRLETNWKQFDFVLLDPYGDLLGVGWGCPANASMDVEYSKFLRSFFPVR